MSNLSDRQDEAAVRGHVDSAAIGTPTTAKVTEKLDVDLDLQSHNLLNATNTGPHDTSLIAAVSSPSFTSGSALQLSTTNDVFLYINVRTAAALTVEIGSDNTASSTVSASQTSGLGVITLRVPKGWFVKLTGTMANLAFTQITC